MRVISICWLVWYADYFDMLFICYDNLLLCSIFVMSFVCYALYLLCWFIWYGIYLIWHLFDIAFIWYGIYLLWYIFVILYICYARYLLCLLFIFFVMLRNTLICTSKFICYPASWRVFWYASSIYGMIVSHTVSILYSSHQFVLYERNLHVH